MPHPTPEFIGSLLGKDASGSTQTRRFNFILLVDAAAHTIASRGLDLTTKQIIEPPTSLKAHVNLGDPLFQSAAIDGKSTGVLLLPEGALLVVCQPITNQNLPGPIHGFMLTSRYLDHDGDLRNLERTTDFALSVRRLDEQTLPEDFSDASRNLAKQGGIYVRPIDESFAGGYALLDDVYGKPALILKVRIPRRMYHQGQVSLLYFVASLGLSGLVFAIAIT
jgi:sensor domain CHASE-containing protein